MEDVGVNDGKEIYSLVTRDAQPNTKHEELEPRVVQESQHLDCNREGDCRTLSSMKSVFTLQWRGPWEL